MSIDELLDHDEADEHSYEVELTKQLKKKLIFVNIIFNILRKLKI